MLQAPALVLQAEGQLIVLSEGGFRLRDIGGEAGDFVFGQHSRRAFLAEVPNPLVSTAHLCIACPGGFDYPISRTHGFRRWSIGGRKPTRQQRFSILVRLLE